MARRAELLSLTRKYGRNRVPLSFMYKVDTYNEKGRKIAIVFIEDVK